MLADFLDQVSQAYESLRGEFSLASDDGRFLLKGEMTSKGHARIKVRMKGHKSQLPDDSNWEVESDFACEPDELRRVLAVKGVI